MYIEFLRPQRALYGGVKSFRHQLLTPFRGLVHRRTVGKCGKKMVPNSLHLIAVIRILNFYDKIVKESRLLKKCYFFLEYINL